MHSTHVLRMPKNWSFFILNAFDFLWYNDLHFASDRTMDTHWKKGIGNVWIFGQKKKLTNCLLHALWKMSVWKDNDRPALNVTTLQLIFNLCWNKENFFLQKLDSSNFHSNYWISSNDFQSLVSFKIKLNCSQPNC